MVVPVINRLDGASVGTVGNKAFLRYSHLAKLSYVTIQGKCMTYEVKQ